MTRNRRPLTDDDVAHRLAAYAAARLSPSPAATARMRAQVMDAVRETPARTARGSSEPVSMAAHRRTPTRPRRALAALMAAALSVLLLTGVAFASGPGGPLYGLRLWVETVSLPSEPGARTDADVNRLDARVDEAVGAARNGNGSAIAAALAAYREILQDALDSASQVNARNDRLEAALLRHQLILATLLANAPDPARDAIEKAIERSDEAVKGMSGAGQGGSQGGGNGGGKPGVHPTPRPGGGHGPDATPKGAPDRTPRGGSKPGG